jgi:hypothetical protein
LDEPYLDSTPVSKRNKNVATAEKTGGLVMTWGVSERVIKA